MFSGTCRSLARCHPARSTCITIKESAKVLATCESQEIHHGGVSSGQDQRGQFPLLWSHGCIDVGIFTHDLSWGARPHAGRSPSAPRLTDPAKTTLILSHLQHRSLIGGLTSRYCRLDTGWKVFLKVACFSALALGWRGRGTNLRHPCRCSKR